MQVEQYVEKVFDTGEVKINFAEWPDNGPPLLFIHGLGGRWQAFARVVPSFISSWHVYAMDLRGHGKSGHTPGRYHRDLYAADAAALVSGLINGHVCIVGHSLGAMTALGVAAKSPDTVRAVVYEDPPLYMHMPGRMEATDFRPRFQATYELALADMSVEDLARAVLEAQPDLSPEMARERAAAIHALDPDVYRRSLDRSASQSFDVESWLRAATPPGLLLQANPEQGAMSDEDAASAALLMPDVVVHRWMDSGHGMHAEHLERFVDEVSAFLADHRDR